MTAADIHVCTCGDRHFADVDPHEWKPRGVAVDKPPATVPPEAVGALTEALYRARWGDEEFDLMFNDRSTGELRRMRDAVDRDVAALVPVVADLIAANTDDTKADALEEAARHAGVAWPFQPQFATWLREEGVLHRRRALRTDTTHKEAEHE